MPTMSITTVDNHLIHYEALGRGEPLIFVHGWLGSWRYWWPAMQALSLQHRTFAFDLWGFGDSSKAQEMYALDTYVSMLDQFIAQLGIRPPVVLVGHALGAAIALRFASRYPERVTRLVGVALPIMGSYINERLKTMSAATFLQKYLGKTHGYPEVESETHKTDPGVVSLMAQELSRESFTADLEHIDCQTLLIYGEQDPVIQIPSDDYNNWQRAGQNRHMVMLTGSTHFPMLEEAAKFNRLMLDFIHADSMTEIAPKTLWQRRTR